MVVRSIRAHPNPPQTTPNPPSNENTGPPRTKRDDPASSSAKKPRETGRKSYFFRCRFSRTRMVTSMGVPSKPKVSRRRRWMKRR